MRNYDKVAWFYDGLSRLVFGRALVNAQLYLLSAIPANARVLIVGGGTGWILEEISHMQRPGLTITYVDASPKMIARAQKRNIDNNVTFITSPIEHAALNGKYDIVLTPFLFDNLAERTAEKVFGYIDGLLQPHALWLYCDYQNTSSLWQRALLKAMYLFFRAFRSIEASHLPNVSAYFLGHNYTITRQKTFFSNFVVSRVYQKP